LTDANARIKASVKYTWPTKQTKKIWEKSDCSTLDWQAHQKHCQEYAIAKNK
jgi:hypothetical protein